MTNPSEPLTEIRIRNAADSDQGRWDEFLEHCADATFYHRYDWIRLNRDELGLTPHPLLAESGATVVGVLPLIRVRSRLFGDMLVSMPFVNFGGPATGDPEARLRLIQDACRLSDELQCDYLELRSRAPAPQLRARSHKVSMTIDLPEDPDELWRAFKSKHRNNVKRAYKNDLQVVVGGVELLDDFYALMELGWRDLGTPLYSKAYFRRVTEAFSNEIRIFVVYKDRTPIAAALNGAFNGTVEGMWAAADPAHHDLQANYVLYWEMIQYAIGKGYQRFHLGRSTKGSGSERYKARWMAEPEQLHWNYHLAPGKELPDLNPDNPKFRIAIKVWRRLPLALTRLLGPHLARLLP